MDGQKDGQTDRQDKNNMSPPGLTVITFVDCSQSSFGQQFSLYAVLDLITLRHCKLDIQISLSRSEG